MRILVTGSSGHLGEALVRGLGSEGLDVIGLDVLEAPTTSIVGSIADRACVRRAVAGADAIVHAATLHKRPRAALPSWRSSAGAEGAPIVEKQHSEGALLFLVQASHLPSQQWRDRFAPGGEAGDRRRRFSLAEGVA